MEHDCILTQLSSQKSLSSFSHLLGITWIGVTHDLNNSVDNV